MPEVINEQKRLANKWKPVLETLGGTEIKDSSMKHAVNVVLENTERELLAEARAMGTQAVRLTEEGTYTTGVDIIDPMMFGIVKRTLPNLIAPGVASVQAIDKPTSIIIAQRVIRGNQPTGPLGVPGDARTGFQQGSALDSNGQSQAGAWQNNTSGDFGSAKAPNELFIDEPDTTFSGTGSQTSNASEVNYDTYNVGHGMLTSVGETLGRGSGGDAAYGTLSVTFEKHPVEAKLRALKTGYSLELLQDLRAVYGVDAEKLHIDILSTEIMAEQNREIINTIRYVGKKAPGQLQYENGAVVVDSSGAAVLGDAAVFDLNTQTDGRWQSEKMKALHFFIDKLANSITKDVRTGRGNFLITSSNVAAALDVGGKLIYAPAIDNNLPADDSGNTFVGVLNGKMKVYIDPYLGYDEIIVGRKGDNVADAGVIFSPYVQAQLVRATAPTDFQPKLAIKSRYAVTANPFSGTNRNSNGYFRKAIIRGL